MRIHNLTKNQFRAVISLAASIQSYSLISKALNKTSQSNVNMKDLFNDIIKNGVVATLVNTGVSVDDFFEICKNPLNKSGIMFGDNLMFWRVAMSLAVQYEEEFRNTLKGIQSENIGDLFLKKIQVEIIHDSLQILFSCALIVYENCPADWNEIGSEFFKRISRKGHFEILENCGITVDLYFHYCKQEIKKFTGQDKYNVRIKKLMKIALIAEPYLRDRL